MPKNTIKILPENLANKIAAGEVIDRPASVVKELIENSIDAGASQIDIIVKAGGKALMQVVDNGCGMSVDDAPVAFQRHSTSKVATFADLENIRTLGFRGEALASIASVSRVEMRTAQPGSKESTVVKVEASKVVEAGKGAPQKGTSIAVKNLFYNTPARRKFLRSNETEYRHILSTLNRFTLAFPEIGFTLFNGDVEVYDLKPASLEKRVDETLGKRVGADMLPIEDRGSLLTITGRIGNWDVVRKSRGDQYIFVNRRYIVDRSLNHAVISAYGEIMPKGHFPVYVIFLEVDPLRVDVNVHPTKTEVKFADQRLVYDLLRGSVKRALARPEVMPEIHPLHEPKGETIEAPLTTRRQQTSFDFTRPNESPREHTPDVESSAVPAAEILGVEERDSEFEQRNVWQLHDRYILSAIKSGLVIIDQHAAHERVLYERALKDFQATSPPAQQLLFPQTVELSAEDFDILTEILPFLTKLGFVIKGFGNRTVVVEGAPTGTRIGNEEKALVDIIDEYRSSRKTGEEMRECIAKSFACHAAIKAGEKLSVETINSLIDQLFGTENPYFCPHGRPVILNITLEELDKRFLR